MKKEKLKVKFPHYWMCSPCAKKMGGVFPNGHVCTVMEGVCKYCNEARVTLVPWVDFNWPKDNTHDSVAKVTRD